MGYTSDHELQEMFPQEPMRRACRRTVRRVGKDLHDAVRSRTPTAHKPAAAPTSEWLASRKRKPGTLKDSWYTVDVPEYGETFAVEERTDDPVAPHVEWDTIAHLIQARFAKRLRWWDAVSKRFALAVHHPGTQGQHMMRDSLAELEAGWVKIGEEELEAWAREYRPGGGSLRVAA